MANKNHKWTNSRGIPVEFQPVAPFELEDTLRGFQSLLPTPPTYETEAGEVFPHDETTVETEEEKAAYEHFVQESARVQGESIRSVLAYLITDSIVVDPQLYADDSDWAERMNFRGKEIPVGKIARKAAFCYSEVFVTPEDIAYAQNAVLKVSGVDMEAAASASKTFRGKVRGRDI